MVESRTRIVRPGGDDFEIEVKSVAQINNSKCVNCGDCRNACPVSAISEKQRIICRLCPSCTDRPALLYKEMEDLAVATSCTTACPLGISPQGYINLVDAGKEEKAFEHIWKHNPLPSICGRICHHPCEEACKRGLLVDEPMAIRGIKRYLTDTFKDFVPDTYPRIYQQEIAVIGAGPAGLAAAHTLAMMGYPVTVFDQEPVAGGMLNVGIPKFRLPRDVIERDVARLEKAGIKFVMGVRISKTHIEELKKHFDSIIVAAGASHSKELMIDGWRKEGVLTALHFMERVNHDQDIWRHPGQEFVRNGDVVVIGGGSVAVDCARTAVRLGAKSVTCVCLESGENVPCHPWELAEAMEEGIKLMEGWSPKQFAGAHNEMTGVRLSKVNKFEKAQDGKISFEIDASQTMTLPADMVIVAIGQAPDKFWQEYADDENIDFAGDIVSSACSVVDAMASGIKAARKTDAKIQGREVKTASADHELVAAEDYDKRYPANRFKIARPPMPMVAPEDRIKNFDEVETEYSKEVIGVEVKRCLQCGFSEVDASKCIGCGICRTVCPKGDVITMVSAGKGGY